MSERAPDKIMDKLKRMKCCVRRWCKRRRTGKDAKQGLKGAVDMESTQVLGETMPENTLLGTQRGGRTEKMDEYETYVPRDQLAPPLRSGFQARKKRFTSNVLYPVTGDILLRMTYHRCCVTLQVLKARNLKAPNKPGYSNPYCKIHVVPPGRAENTYNYRTRYISQNVSPEWKETFTFQGIDPDEINHKKIAISVWHYNPMWVDIFLGEVVVDLKDPINLDETRRWYQLN